MSDISWDIMEEQMRLVADLNDFLYEDGKPLRKGGIEGTYREHTESEYREYLKGIQTYAISLCERIRDEIE